MTKSTHKDFIDYVEREVGIEILTNERAQDATVKTIYGDIFVPAGATGFFPAPNQPVARMGLMHEDRPLTAQEVAELERNLEEAFEPPYEDEDEDEDDTEPRPGFLFDPLNGMTPVKPCPFCGTDLLRFVHTPAGIAVQCQNCEATGRSGDWRKERAIYGWNRRAEEPTPLTFLTHEARSGYEFRSVYFRATLESPDVCQHLAGLQNDGWELVSMMPSSFNGREAWLRKAVVTV